MTYAPHEDLLIEARKKPELWRFAAGIVLVLALWFMLGLAFDSLVLPLLIALTGGGDFLNGNDPTGMALLLGGFVLPILAVALALPILHARSLGSLLGSRGRFLWQGRRVTLALVALLVVLLILPPYDMGAPVERNMHFGQWLSYLPLALGLVLIQTSAEEILFRGYLQQGLAARFQSPLIWMGLPSVLFGLGHYMPTEAGDNAWLIVAGATFYGLVMADLTARSGSLGPAIAVHFVNNVFALLILATPTSLSGFALLLQPITMEDAALRPWLWLDFAVITVSWLAARVAIRA